MSSNTDEARGICWVEGYCNWWNPPQEMRGNIDNNDFCIRCWKWKYKKSSLKRLKLIRKKERR